MADVNSSNTKSEIYDAYKSQNEELEALRARLEAAEEAQADSAVDDELLARLDALEQRNNALMTALNGERAAKDRLREVGKERSGDEETYTVENVGGTNIWVRVHDHRGVEIRKVFEGMGAKHDLTAGQIAEIQNERPDLFSRGMLSAPDVIPDSPNVIRDFDEFLDAGTMEEVTESVRTLTDERTLLRLNDYIESKKFRTEDEEGRPFQNIDDAGSKHAYMEEVELPARYAAIQAAIRERLQRVRSDIDLSDG